MLRKGMYLGGRKLTDVSRRDFLKFCSAMAACMGLPLGMGSRIAEAATSPKRPPVIWLSFQECTGCTESLLRTHHPTLEHLILDLISLEYHETLSTPSGHNLEAVREKSIKANKGKFVLVVDGAIPVKDGGIYCKIAGKTALEHIKEVAPHAAAIIAIGSCAAWGGIPAASPNPTGASSVSEVLKGYTVVNIPGCAPNPYNFLSTVLYFVTFKKLPALDDKGRPKFAYGRLIHENCERRPHFDAGRFAMVFGDEGHRQGYCLYKLGCKGPETYNNCPSLLFGDTGSGSWPVGIGHPCFGCSEKGVGFNIPIHSPSRVQFFTPPATYPGVRERQGEGLTAGSAAILAGVGGAAIGAGAMLAKNLGKSGESAGSGKSGAEEK